MATRRRRAGLIAAAVALVLAGAAWLAIGVAFDGYTIPTDSMAPTLERGDRVLARSVDGHDLSRGEVVIFDAASATAPSGVQRISRVIAFAGEQLAAVDGQVTIDGAGLEEPYLRHGAVTTDLAPTTVPEGHVFLLSDNRTDAQDSRVLGPIPRDDVQARVTFLWWPIGHAGPL